MNHQHHTAPTVRSRRRPNLWVFLFTIALLAAPGPSLAQVDTDDVYDPFADYSEFEENSQEEADIHFFRNGRFFNLAFLLGWQQFTSSYGTYVDPAISPGFYFAYFFNLRFAVQVEYTFTSHNYYINGDNNPNFSTIQGNIEHSVFAAHFKAYLNTQNITRGLAALNPYLFVGLSQNYRTFNISGVSTAAKDDSTGFDLGGGIEFPIFRNTMYLGLQGFFRLVDFPSENIFIKDANQNSTGVTLSGDEFDVHLIFGINF